jgi:DNA-binding Lrp family transcriptional regulator
VFFDMSYGLLVEIDGIDRALIHALNIDGRAPFSQIAAVLSLSDQTVARRYRRLRATSIARVVGQTLFWRVGHVRWFLRIRCAPNAALAVATALGRRPDTYWVRMYAGGTEIGCVAQSSDRAETDNLLLQKLPHTPRVLDITAHNLLHVFFGGPAVHLNLVDGLTPEQVDALRPGIVPSVEVIDLDDADHRMLALLEEDGRAGFAAIAKATGWSESTARRRLEFLRESGALFFDVDVDAAVLGYKSEAMMWLSVPPAEMEPIGEALAQHPEIAFVGATTGTANLVASVVCRDVSDFYRYLTTRVAALTAIHHIETSPVIRTVKRGATLLTQ